MITGRIQVDVKSLIASGWYFPQKSLIASGWYLPQRGLVEVYKSWLGHSWHRPKKDGINFILFVFNFL